MTVTPTGATGRSTLRPEVADVARLWRRAVRGTVEAARHQTPAGLTEVLSAHFGSAATDIGELAVVEEQWASYEHVNVQNALDAWLDAPERAHELVGIIGYQHRPFGLADLLTPRAATATRSAPGQARRRGSIAPAARTARSRHACAVPCTW